MESGVGVELKATDLHWLENSDPYEDCCIHGKIFLRIGDRVVSDGKAEWTVSTAAFNLLRTVTRGHELGDEEELIPCCGFNMWEVETARDGLYIPNCNSGIDWSVRHTHKGVEHVISDAMRLFTCKEEWARAVCLFADEVHLFFGTAWPKQIKDDEDRRGFELFLKLWQERRKAAGVIYGERDTE